MRFLLDTPRENKKIKKECENEEHRKKKMERPIFLDCH